MLPVVLFVVNCLLLSESLIYPNKESNGQYDSTQYYNPFEYAKLNYLFGENTQDFFSWDQAYSPLYYEQTSSPLTKEQAYNYVNGEQDYMPFLNWGLLTYYHDYEEPYYDEVPYDIQEPYENDEPYDDGVPYDNQEPYDDDEPDDDEPYDDEEEVNGEDNEYELNSSSNDDDLKTDDVDLTIEKPLQRLISKVNYNKYKLDLPPPPPPPPPPSPTILKPEPSSILHPSPQQLHTPPFQPPQIYPPFQQPINPYMPAYIQALHTSQMMDRMMLIVPFMLMNKNSEHDTKSNDKREDDYIPDSKENVLNTLESSNNYRNRNR